MREQTSSSVLSIVIISTVVALLMFFALKSFTQKNVWQPGIIAEVKPHQDLPGDPGAAQRYDVSIVAGRTIYVALYAPEQPEPEPAFYVGMTCAVHIKGDTLKLRDLEHHPRTFGILSRKRTSTAASE